MIANLNSPTLLISNQQIPEAAPMADIAHSAPTLAKGLTKPSSHPIAAGYDLGWKFLWKLIKEDPTPPTTRLGKLFDTVIGRKPLELDAEKADAQGSFCQLHQYVSKAFSKLDYNLLCSVRFIYQKQVEYKQESAPTCLCIEDLCLEDHEIEEYLSLADEKMSNVTSFSKVFTVKGRPVEVRYTNLAGTFPQSVIDQILNDDREPKKANLCEEKQEQTIKVFGLVSLGFVAMIGLGSLGSFFWKKYYKDGQKKPYEIV